MWVLLDLALPATRTKRTAVGVGGGLSAAFSQSFSTSLPESQERSPHSRPQGGSSERIVGPPAWEAGERPCLEPSKQLTRSDPKKTSEGHISAGSTLFLFQGQARISVL